MIKLGEAECYTVRRQSHVPRCRYDICPANTEHLYNICTMLGQRCRRWTDVVQMLYKCFVLAGWGSSLIYGSYMYTGVIWIIAIIHSYRCYIYRGWRKGAPSPILGKMLSEVSLKFADILYCYLLLLQQQ